MESFTFLDYLISVIMALWVYIGYHFVRYLEQRFIGGKKLYYVHAFLITLLWPFAFLTVGFTYVVGYIRGYVSKRFRHHGHDEDSFL